MQKGRPVPPAPEDWQRWKADRLAELRALSFRTFPDRIPAAEPRLWSGPGKHQRWLATEPGIEVAIADLRRPGDRGCTAEHLIVLNEGESLDCLAVLGQRDRGQRRRGDPGPAWSWADCLGQKSPPNYVARAHVLLGRTVDEGRVWDAAAVARWLAEHATEGRPWRIAGSRQAGVIAAYAALFEPAVAEVVVVDPPASHRDGPIFLGVLQRSRHADGPGASGTPTA